MLRDILLARSQSLAMQTTYKIIVSITEHADEKRRSWKSSADAQADLRLCSKCSFSYVLFRKLCSSVRGF